MLHKLAALFVIALAALCVFLFASPAGPVPAVYAASLTALALAALLTPIRPGVFRANTIDAELNLNVILDASLTAFKRAILPLTMFATVFRNVALQGTNKVVVPYYALETSASKDFSYADGYIFDDDTNTAQREITINKRKYQPMSLTSEELARYPLLNAQKLGAQKGEKLAYDIIQDILSVVTAANYGAAVFTGDTTGFNSDDVVDIRTAINKIPWPEVGRGLLLNSDYDGALFKDSDVKLEYAYGDNGVIKEGMLSRLLGFQYGSSPVLPTNGENLVGMAAFESAILAAFSPITPAPAVMARLTRYEVVTDESGISLEYRVWGDPDNDIEKHTIECNYGFANGEANALKRLVSA